LLARERRHEIRGQLLPLERTAGQVVTAGWRKHPAAGIVVITTLPVWSLIALDHKQACAEWLAELVEQAGKPVEGEDEGGDGSPTSRVPSPDEWTLLLHLCTGPFEGSEASLKALGRSVIHHLPAECTRTAMEGLMELGLMEEGNLTAEGERTLLEGPYANYARALRRRK